tara:strand:- start:61 stop:528 length:468 start_codon:yes stop_codon:yes gene_type:complete
MKNYTLISIIIFGFIGCSETKNSNILDSDNYNTKKERVEILKNEIKYYSDFENAEFELFNVNGFSNSRTLVPGASSVDYKFVVQVNPSDIDKWTNEMNQINPNTNDYNWMNKIIRERLNDWKTESKPDYYSYEGGNILMVVYKSEGIIFKSFTNL